MKKRVTKVTKLRYLTESVHFSQYLHLHPVVAKVNTATQLKMPSDYII